MRDRLYHTLAAHVTNAMVQVEDDSRLSEMRKLSHTLTMNMLGAVADEVRTLDTPMTTEGGEPLVNLEDVLFLLGQRT